MKIFLENILNKDIYGAKQYIFESLYQKLNIKLDEHTNEVIQKIFNEESDDNSSDITISNIVKKIKREESPIIKKIKKSEKDQNIDNLNKQRSEAFIKIDSEV